MDLLFKFHIRLNASYLDAKRVGTWEIDENPLGLKSSEEARSKPKVSNTNSCFDISKHNPCVL